MMNSQLTTHDSQLFQAAVFDLDGVVTFTARVHAAAWKQLFDEYLRSREKRFGEKFQEFDPEHDYRAYVDGLPRYQGVKRFLESRGIQTPFGAPTDSPDQETVCGLGNKKDKLFVAKVRDEGVDVDQECVRFIRDLRANGIAVGLASSSRNAALVLESAGLVNLFDARVDGVVSDELKLQGKPHPDIFLTCLAMLTKAHAAPPSCAMVIEDAISGVEAGHAGGFGLVLGVDRHGEAASLRQHGADLVIADFREISVEKVQDFFRAHATAA